ncbi:CAP domain-containing protein [Corynebacterium sp.]|uniref:CAP domain-containing protein n=1 Tax=Corynebacterium sp. TaxID=1720 RepID=UPI0026DBA9C9|nr:CAP domain-containing protein [Corynebacterium sp.]MDO4609721.1 CAP domain-containing protein [Corynebacterium sp.]
MKRPVTSAITAATFACAMGVTIPAANATTVEDSIIAQVNQHRVAHGLKPVMKDANVQGFSEWWAKYMADHLYYKHADTVTGEDRYFENIAKTSAASPDWASHAFQMWKKSPGHNGNMLNPTVTKAGAHCYPSDDGYAYCVLNLDW